MRAENVRGFGVFQGGYGVELEVLELFLREGGGGVRAPDNFQTVRCTKPQTLNPKP